MTPLTHQQASMLASNVLNIIQFSFIHESPESTSPLSHKDDLSITQHKIRAIVTEAAENTVINVLCCLNLLFHEFIHTSEHQPSIFILTTLIQAIPTITSSPMTSLISTLPHTHMDTIKPKNIDYFNPKPYAKSIISDSEHSPTIHDIFLFVNCIHEIVNQTFNQFIPIKLSLQGTAMEWFHSELSPSEHSKLHTISV